MGRFSLGAGRGRPAVTVTVTVQISVAAATEVVTPGQASRVNAGASESLGPGRNSCCHRDRD